MLSRTSNNFKLSSLSAKEINHALKEKTIVQKENLVYVLTPLRNYIGEVQGVGAVQIDIGDTVNTFKGLIKSVLIVSLIILVVLLALIIFTTKKIVLNRLQEIDHTLEDMSNGLIKHEIKQNSHDEIGNMVQSLNKLIKRNSETATFAKEIENNKFDSEFQSLSENDLY